MDALLFSYQKLTLEELHFKDLRKRSLQEIRKVKRLTRSVNALNYEQNAIAKRLEECEARVLRIV